MSTMDVLETDQDDLLTATQLTTWTWDESDYQGDADELCTAYRRISLVRRIPGCGSLSVGTKDLLRAIEMEP